MGSGSGKVSRCRPTNVGRSLLRSSEVSCAVPPGKIDRLLSYYLVKGVELYIYEFAAAAADYNESL